jgi:hypothetical protein
MGFAIKKDETHPKVYERHECEKCTLAASLTAVEYLPYESMDFFMA